jgi:hypothetical protein
MPGGRNPLPGFRSVFGATAFVGGTAAGGASSSEAAISAEINALLGTSGNVALEKLKGRLPIDLTGPSASMLRSHMNNWFVGSRSQILTYSRPSFSFLKSMFGL